MKVKVPKVPNEKRKGLLFIVGALACGIVAALFILGLGSKMTPQVPALEARVEIEPGDPLDRNMFREVKLPEAGLPSEIIHPDTDLSGMIASRSMYPGDILRYPSAIETESESPSLFSARLKALNDPSLRGVEIPVDSIEGMLHGMKSRDLVDIEVVFKEYDSSVDDEVLVSETIIEGAPVIGIRSEGSEGVSNSTKKSLVVALTKQQVKLFALYREKGVISVSLRPLGETKTENRHIEGVSNNVKTTGDHCPSGDC